jgi:hypothetical protein
MTLFLMLFSRSQNSNEMNRKEKPQTKVKIILIICNNIFIYLKEIKYLIIIPNLFEIV